MNRDGRVESCDGGDLIPLPLNYSIAVPTLVSPDSNANSARPNCLQRKQ